MKYISQSYFIFAVTCICFVTVSCDFFNASLPEYIQEYTRNVAVEMYTFDDDYPRNPDGIECIPSNKPVKVTVRLRNPQRYNLTALAAAQYETGGGAISSKNAEYIIVDQNTKDTVTMSFIMDMAAEGNPVTIFLWLSRADGLRNWEYTIDLKCNTVPSVPVPVSYDGSVYRLAENTPWVSYNGVYYWTYPDVSGSIHNDVTDFIVNGEKKPRAGWNEVLGTILDSSGGTAPYFKLYSVSAGIGSGTISVKAADTDMLESAELNAGVTLRTVTYNANGGSAPIPSPERTVPGVPVTVDFASVPGRTGYTFGGWKDDAGKPAADYVAGGVMSFVMPDADVTLYAHWVAITDYYVSAGGSSAGDGSSGSPYATIQQAVSAGTAVADDITVWLLSDISGQNDAVTIPNGKTVRLKNIGTYTVTKASTVTGSFITVDSNAALILGGAEPVLTLDGGSSGDGNSAFVKVSAHGTFTLINGNIIDNRGGGVAVDGGTFTMSGGNISGNSKTRNGGGVFVGDGGTFTMSGGNISSNRMTGSVGHGGGVYVDAGGTFTMSGGRIDGNSTLADGNGSGVFVAGAVTAPAAAGGTFTMSGGRIDGNSTGTRGSGGGVFVGGGVTGVSVAGGTFTMNGGQIDNNTAATNGNGGGVAVDGGAFTMGGGNISGNATAGNGGVNGGNGGGVSLSAGSTFTMNGGQIGGNTVGSGGDGGGVYVNASMFTMGGAAVAAGDNLVFLATSGSAITVNDSGFAGAAAVILPASSYAAGASVITGSAVSSAYDKFVLSFPPGVSGWRIDVNGRLAPGP